ncbi:MAG: PilZ domain-containing protein [Sulfuricaulis sp.]
MEISHNSLHPYRDEREEQMNFEHRKSIRKRTSVNILINSDLAYSKSWTVRDLSVDGALIEADRVDLPLGALVEAVLTFEVRRQRDLFRLPANVVRADRNAVALKFRDYDSRAYTALVNFLYAS